MLKKYIFHPILHQFFLQEVKKMKYTRYLAIVAVIWAVISVVKTFTDVPIEEASFMQIATMVGNILIAVGLVYNDTKTKKIAEDK